MKRDHVDLVQSLLADGLSIAKKVSGDSMLPSIPSGVVLQIEPLVQTKPKLGDVVFFETPNGKTTIHRVSLCFRRKSHMWIQTWGDNCQKPDAPVPISKVLGRITSMQINGDWKPLRNNRILYFHYFIKRYGWFYLGKTLEKMKRILTGRSSSSRPIVSG